MAKGKGKGFAAWFTGNVVANEGFVRRIPLLVYICVLMLLYMANGFRAQRRHTRADYLTNRIKELRTVSYTTSAIRMTESRQTEVEKRLKERGIELEYNESPPRLILVDNPKGREIAKESPRRTKR